MAEPDIAQEEADALLLLDKISATDEFINLPDFGGRVDMPFTCVAKREEFVISFTRSAISLVKRSHHLRGRRVVGLARLDLDGPPHRNPDGTEMGSRHLHIYREGYGLKFAIEIPAGLFRNLDDAFATLEDFLRYCHVITPPRFNKGLFT